MPRSYRRVFAAVACALACTCTSPSRAGFIGDVAVGLAYVGFDIEGVRNPIGPGFDLQVSRTFVGNPLDFGPWDITLQGPLSLSVNTGGRAVQEWEISLNTAPDENTASRPLSYVLNVDSGSQAAEIAGNLLIDADMKINNLGFYEINLTYSSRQTVTREGRFANDENEFDFDVGPIVVSGNIVADVLAILTEPLFQAAGRPNPFADFSASAKLNDALQIAIGDLQQQLADGLVEPALAPGGEFATILANRIHTDPTQAAGPHAVPEPPVLLLMAIAIPLLIARPLRRICHT